MLGKIVGTIYSDSIRPIQIAPSSEYEALVKKMLDRIRFSEAKKGEPVEILIWFDWLPKKRSDAQLRLFWKLLEMAATMNRTGPVPETVARAEVEALYEDYLARLGPRVDAYLAPQAAEGFQELYERVIERAKCENGMIYVKAIVGASQWTQAQAGAAIDYWLNELAEIGVPVDMGAELAHIWREWRMALAEIGLDVAAAAKNQDEYKERTPICEACGTWIGTGGELAHIQAVGMGGDRDKVQDGPGNWLHLCTEDHRNVQHQKGWLELFKKAPWLKDKCDKAMESEESE